MNWLFDLLRDNSFERGYEYVKTEFYKFGEEAIPRLVIEADNPFDYGDFEKGMNEALRDINKGEL